MTIMIVFPTYRAADYTFRECMINLHSVVFKARKYPLKITFINGDEWLFTVDTARNLRGYHGEIIRAYDYSSLMRYSEQMIKNILTAKEQQNDER